MKLTKQISYLLESNMDDEFIVKLFNQLKKEPDLLTWSIKPLQAKKIDNKIVVDSFEKSKDIIIPNFDSILEEIYQDRYNKKPSNISDLSKKVTSLIKNKNISFELADGNLTLGKAIVMVKNANYKNGNLVIDKYEV